MPGSDQEQLLQLQDLATGLPVSSVPLPLAPRHAVHTLRWSRDGSLLAVYCHTGAAAAATVSDSITIRIFDAQLQLCGAADVCPAPQPGSNFQASSNIDLRKLMLLRGMASCVSSMHNPAQRLIQRSA